jgi:hypothetical protein
MERQKVTCAFQEVADPSIIGQMESLLVLNPLNQLV